MQAIKVIVFVACLSGVASAASWSSQQSCEDCKTTAETLKRDILLLQVLLVFKCKFIGANEAQCVADVNKLVDSVSKYTPEEMCQATGECPSKMPLFALRSQEQTKCLVLLCEPCKQVAKLLEIGAPQAKDQLEKICKSHSAPEEVKKCEQAIGKLVQQIKEKSAEKICAAIGLCEKD